jgi:tripartite-type tricarboxylate transporter receptor subunit TctC
VVNALADAKVRQNFAAQGQDIWPRQQQTPQALAALYKADIDKWWPIIRDENLHAE